MNIPPKIGHNFTFHEQFEIDLLSSRFATHRRLRVFHHHGRKCANPGCGKEGVFLIKAKNTDGGFHIDLYTEQYELMTIDHIVPKSKGGKNTLENLQPMCHTCNTKKADKS
jgi:5-methylcytosine-specific restriction endonuclease McrA